MPPTTGCALNCIGGTEIDVLSIFAMVAHYGSKHQGVDLRVDGNLFVVSNKLIDGLELFRVTYRSVQLCTRATIH